LFEAMAGAFDGAGDELIPIESDGDDASPGSSLNYLKFGKHSVPMDDDEMHVLEERLSAYQEQNGSSFGFIRTIIDG